MQKGLAIFLGTWMAFSAAARAAIFTINPLQSSLTIISANVAGNIATQQPPSGFTTSYTGTIDATVTALSIQFNSASADGMVSGSYQPLVGGGAGSAPGDYGGMFTVGGLFPGFFSVRDLVASLTSSSLSLSGGNFDATQLLFTALSGSGDYRVAALALVGTTSLVGSSAPNAAPLGSISMMGGVQTLTIPVDVTLVFTAVNPNDSMIRFTGNIVATAIPEPATYMLFGIGLLACAQWFRRKKNK